MTDAAREIHPFSLNDAERTDIADFSPRPVSSDTPDPLDFTIPIAPLSEADRAAIADMQKELGESPEIL